MFSAVTELGESCQPGDEPNIEYSECRNGIWNCELDRAVSKNNQKCEKGIGSVCETDMDCTTKNAECANNVCTCRKYYYLSNDQCLPGIASSCDNDTDCKPENSECRVGHCYCLIGYVAESINSCLPVAAYGDSCEKDIQCSAELPNAVCLHVDNSISNTTNSTCACAEGYHYNYLRCHKRRVLGMSCMNLAECYLDSGDRVVCKNGRCACDSGYIQVNNTVCKEIQRYNINACPNENPSHGRPRRDVEELSRLIVVQPSRTRRPKEQPAHITRYHRSVFTSLNHLGGPSNQYLDGTTWCKHPQSSKVHRHNHGH
ncbi:hypothetical protein WH47_04428 [Habropoda laboriosa]|uniref:EGF-like domain-containing protein n=1 Tax=Habropoda laboriosa TaxID=597456 RepID=A0A0L7QWN3_9HYME|nr:hypothetical protein WH47_04428 [Habropoda laboriosa]